MNAAQAKRLPLRRLLAQLGFHPQREDAAKGELWYLSPFRQEATPSFKVHLANNVWYDFGLAGGGNVIDFAMAYFRLGFTEALRKLATLEGGLLPLALATPPKIGPSSLPARSSAIITPRERDTAGAPAPTLRPLTNRALIAYLARRGIPVEIARPYLREMHYTRGGKSYFALAFTNASGGYELRNPYFKGSQAPKDIARIEGTPAAAALFEGFMDFLSALTCRALADPPPTVIVLNSAALREKALRSIRAGGATTVELYFDHDATGRDLTAYFRDRLASLTVIDRSDRYAGHKDFNAWLEAGGSRPAARPRSTGMRRTPTWTGSGGSCRSSRCGAWRAGRPSTGPTPTRRSKPSWKRTSWHSATSGASFGGCGTTILERRCSGSCMGHGGKRRRGLSPSGRIGGSNPRSAHRAQGTRKAAWRMRSALSGAITGCRSLRRGTWPSSTSSSWRRVGPTRRGRWPASYDRFWQGLIDRLGRSAGTREMIGLLQLGRAHGYADTVAVASLG